MRSVPRLSRSLSTLKAMPRSDPSAPPMLRFQSFLPSLPVPPLSSTISKYLDTVQPLLSPSQFAKTKQIAADFLASPHTATLQSRLEQRAVDPSQRGNWLADWWNDAAYMGYRDPVVVYVSYYFVHLHDRRVRDQAKRAAQLVKAMLPFRDMVESGTLEPDTIRGQPLCMESYKWLFHSTRLPARPSDIARKFDPKQNNHIAVLRKNRVFIVFLVDSAGNELSAPALELQFSRIIAAAGSEPHPIPIGTLTADNRDAWTDAREALLAVDGSVNAELLDKLGSSLLVLALDDTSPVTRDDISRQCWVGDGRNRWYDKHQLIVFENGRSGFLGEHSCMDGTPTLRMNEFVLASLEKGKVDLSGTVDTALPPPEELEFKFDQKTRTLVSDAEKRFDDLVGKHELYVLQTPLISKSLAKEHRTSPDALAQLTKQLAFYKMNARMPAVYESAQTRRFARGRTEVLRSVSIESKRWVDGMVEASESIVDSNPVALRELFRAAAKRHAEYAAWAADGQGVDRHLFGLKKCITPEDGDAGAVKAFYADPAFSKSSHWELSTSQLSSPYFDGWGYGEVVPDGYGLSYAIGDDYVRWTITSLKRESSPTAAAAGISAAVLRHYLEEAAEEVRSMLVRAGKVETMHANANVNASQVARHVNVVREGRL